MVISRRWRAAALFNVVMICSHLCAIAMADKLCSDVIRSCNKSTWALVSNATQGIEVTVFSADDGNDTFTTTEVTNHFLPSECGVNYQLCNLLVVGQFLIIPANRSLIIYPLQTNTASHATMIQNIPINCNPTGISAPFQDSSLVVECRNIADHSLTYLFLSISETGRLRLINFRRPRPYHAEKFSRSHSTSHACHAAGRSIYVVADNGIVSYGVSGFQLQEIVNCQGVSHTEYIEETGSLAIYCTNDVAVTYSICSSDLRYYNLMGGIPYFCSSKTVFFTNESIRVEGKDGNVVLARVNHALRDIAYGKCQDDKYFVMTTKSGSLYSLQFNTSSPLSLISNATCKNGSCVIPAFNPTSSEFLAFDFENESVVSVNLLEGCTGPIREFFNTNSTVSLMTAISSTDTMCSCEYCNTPTTEEVTPAETNSTPTEMTENIVSDSVTTDDSVSVTTHDSDGVTTDSVTTDDSVTTHDSDGVTTDSVTTDDVAITTNSRTTANLVVLSPPRLASEVSSAIIGVILGSVCLVLATAVLASVTCIVRKRKRIPPTREQQTQNDDIMKRLSTEEISLGGVSLGGQTVETDLQEGVLPGSELEEDADDDDDVQNGRPETRSEADPTEDGQPSGAEAEIPLALQNEQAENSLQDENIMAPYTVQDMQGGGDLVSENCTLPSTSGIGSNAINESLQKRTNTEQKRNERLFKMQNLS